MTDITTKPVSTDRLNQIARAIADGNYRELTMRIPAEPDRDADLVISAAADEIDRLRAEVACYAEANRHLIDMHDAVIDDARKYSAAQAEIARLREALEKLCEMADESDGAQYGTLGTNFVRGIARAALAPVVAK